MVRPSFIALGLLIVAADRLPAQDRLTKVQNDLKTFADSRDWIYNDLNEGIRVAKEAGKPLFVVLRCIPCEACQEFDDDVARRDPIIRDLLDEYVCVRLVQANSLDLNHFQDDFDMSFAVFLMNPDLTLYGRYATRSERPETQDISLEGLRKAMAEGLRIHRAFASMKPALEGKQPRPVRFKTPREYPALAGKYAEKINYSENTVRSCLHCHQVREAERHLYRDAGEPIPDEVLFPYPDPEVLGLRMDPKELATIQSVAPGSVADRAGLRPGDAIVTLAGQPLLSIADLQWVLQNTPSAAQLAALVRRDGKTSSLTLELPDGWRRGSNISWRTSSWDLRRMSFGGMALEDLDAAERRQAGLAPGAMALRARYVANASGQHGIAARAGFQKDDILIAYDGQSDRKTESQLMAYALQHKRPGDTVAIIVRRGGEPKTLHITLP